MKIRSLIWSTMLLLILAAYLPVMAQDMSEAAKETKRTISGSPEAPQVLTSDVGEVVVKTYAKTQDGLVTRGVGQYQLVPGMSIITTVPQGSPGDLLIVTFTGECSLLGASDPSDHVLVQLRVTNANTVIIPPTDGINNGVAFCSASTASSNSVQGIIRLPPGPHRIQAFWRVVGTTPPALTGQLSHYTLSILQSQ